MVFALECLRADVGFRTGVYDFEAVKPYEKRIKGILGKRQTDASAAWKAFAEELSGSEIEDFDEAKYKREYTEAPESGKNDTFLGKYILAALAQKSMVTNRIFTSGNPLAGISIDFRKKGFAGIRDFRRLVEEHIRRRTDD